MRRPIASRSSCQSIVKDDLAAIGLCGALFHGGGVVGHHDDAGDVEDLAGEGNRLGVIAGGERQHAAFPLVGGEARERVIGAAELEGAGALEVLALEEELGAGEGVERSRGRDRRAMRDAGDLPRGVLDVGKRRPRGRGQCHLDDMFGGAMLSSGFFTSRWSLVGDVSPRSLVVGRSRPAMTTKQRSSQCRGVEQSGSSLGS